MEYEIRDSQRNYFTIMPNILDDMNLSVYAYRLYSHIKRVAGEKGLCYQSTDTLAKSCNMSSGSVSQAKQELKEAGLINIAQRKSNNGKPLHVITIKDIWQKNIDACAKTSSDEPITSPHEIITSPGEMIKNTINKNKDSTPSRKEKTMKAIQEGYAEQEKHPNMFYPPDIIDTVTAFESAFKIKPPRRKETNFGLWIQKCKEINSLCAAYKRKPAEVIKQYFLAWDKDGRYYAVNGPESILKSLRGFLAEKESGTQYRGANGEVETF